MIEWLFNQKLMIFGIWDSEIWYKTFNLGIHVFMITIFCPNNNDKQNEQKYLSGQVRLMKSKLIDQS